jgi:putative ABC transport system permease protein
MMTGQILAGEDPLSAVKYQILIMFMIAAAVAITSMIMVLLAYRRFFTDDHRLDIGPIRKRG